MTNKFSLNLLGFNPDLTSRQPRVDSLSLVSRQSDLLTYLGRIAAILVLVLTIGVGNAWGEHTVVKAGDMVSGEKYIITAEYNNTRYYLTPGSFDVGKSTAGTYTTSLTDAAAWTFTKSSTSWTISTKVGDNTVYLANTNANNGVKTQASSQTWTVVATTNGASTVTITGASSRKLALYQGSNWRSYTSSSGVQTITLYRCSDVSCTTNPTVTAGSNSSVTATTATVSCSNGISSLGSEGCSISSYGFVLGTSANPTIDNTVHEVGTSYTTTGTSFSKDLTGLSAETTYYVRPYATNGNGTAYGTQTSFTTPALPKYTVTLKDDGDTRTQASAGASVTLPSREGCAGYTFAGWTKTWVTDQKEWTTIAPAIIPAGSYTPTANENLYPVYTKEEGGGGSSTVTFTPGTDKGETSITKNGVTCTMSTMNNASYYQIYANASGTFSVASGNITAISFTCTANGTTKYGPGNASADVGTYTYSGATGSWSGSASSVTISSTAQVRMKALSITCSGGSTTSYISVPNCCTALGSIKGSISWSSTSATLTWDDIANVNSWAVACKNTSTGIAAGTVGSITTNGAGKKTCTITNLTCGGTGYTFTISATAASGYCDKSWELTGSTTACTDPAITVSPASLTGLDYIVGNGPSTAQSFTVSGANLNTNLVVSAPANYEVCKTADGTYTSTISYTPSDGAVANTTAYIRLAAGLNVGTYNYAAASGLQVTSTGAKTRTAALNGSVTKADCAITFTDFNAVDHYEATLEYGSRVTVSYNYTYNGDGTFSISRSPATGTIDNANKTLTVSAAGIWTLNASATAGTNYSKPSDASAQIRVKCVDTYKDFIHNKTIKAYGSGTAVTDGKMEDWGSGYTVPYIEDNAEETSGSCQQTHYKFMGWVSEDDINIADGTFKTGWTLIQAGTPSKPATTKTYYAVWAKLEE